MITTEMSDDFGSKDLGRWIILTAIDDDIGDKGYFRVLWSGKEESFLIYIDFFGKILCVFNHNSFIDELLKNNYKSRERGR